MAPDAPPTSPSPAFPPGGPAPQPRKSVTWPIWLAVTFGLGLLIAVPLAWLYFSPAPAQFGDSRPAKHLALALVADDPAHASGPPLHDFTDPAKTYLIERNLTLPGDVEYVQALKNDMGRPEMKIHISDAGVNRMNSGPSFLGRKMAVVLNGRTVLAAAQVHAPLQNDLLLMGALTPGDILRMMDAISSTKLTIH